MDEVVHYTIDKDGESKLFHVKLKYFTTFKVQYVTDLKYKTFEFAGYFADPHNAVAYSVEDFKRLHNDGVLIEVVSVDSYSYPFSDVSTKIWILLDR